MLNYKGLRAVRETLKVSEEMIDQQINKLLEQRMKITPITGRLTQIDDEVVLDYAGEVDGLFFEGGTATNQTLVLGSGMFIPGFEEQLIGKNVGDEVDVNVTFPEQYHAPDLAGKAAVFHCKINGIRLREKYAADDTFAKEVGGCETFAQMREEMRKALQDYVDNQADAELKNKLLDMVIEGSAFEISDEQLEAGMDAEIANLEAQLGRQGLNIELYCQFMNTTKEQLREDMRAEALGNIQRQMAINEIAEIEHIEADINSISDAIQEICRENNITVEQLQPHMDEKFQQALGQSVMNTKVLNFLRDNAVIEDVVKEA